MYLLQEKNNMHILYINNKHLKQIKLNEMYSNKSYVSIRRFIIIRRKIILIFKSYFVYRTTKFHRNIL